MPEAVSKLIRCTRIKDLDMTTLLTRVSVTKLGHLSRNLLLVCGSRGKTLDDNFYRDRNTDNRLHKTDSNFNSFTLAGERRRQETEKSVCFSRDELIRNGSQFPQSIQFVDANKVTCTRLFRDPFQ